MRWQFSARLTSLIVLTAVSLAVGGAALGLALARGGSAGVSEQADAQVSEGWSATMPKADSRMAERGEGKRNADRYDRGRDGRRSFHDWRGSRRVIVVPRIEVYRSPFVKDGRPIMRGFDRSRPERQAVRTGGMVIAVGEVTAVHEDAIEMYTVLGNDVTIDVSQLPLDSPPEVGASAIVIAQRDGDGYVAQSVDLLNVRLSEMLEGMRARSRSTS